MLFGSLEFRGMGLSFEEKTMHTNELTCIYFITKSFLTEVKDSRYYYVHR
jgi:hypothetical protein